MKELPILFSAPMVRAILAGQKTQTRRIATKITQDPHDGRWRIGNRYSGVIYQDEDRVKAPNGAVASEYAAYRVGERLWVRETWQSDVRNYGLKPRDIPEGEPIFYAAGGSQFASQLSTCAATWRSSLFMMRWMSRLTLEITDVRVQRLNEISEDDAMAEGVDAVCLADIPRPAAWSRCHDFSRLWESINGEGSWQENPFVWAITFKRIGSAYREKAA